jgi:hypothetical protein
MQKTIREVISEIKKGLKEVHADSKMTNKFVYSKLTTKSLLIIQRESDALRLANSFDTYQTLPCVEVIDIPAIDKNCRITSKKRLYRTKGKLPDMYFDAANPIIRSIRSLDRFGKTITLTNLDSILRGLQDTNSKYDKNIYAWFEEGYLYFTEKVPVRVEALFVADVKDWCGCDCDTERDKPCTKFLDGRFYAPEKLIDSIISLVIQDLANSYKRLPDQQVIDKNPNV